MRGSPFELIYRFVASSLIMRCGRTHEATTTLLARTDLIIASPRIMASLFGRAVGWRGSSPAR